MKNPLRCFIEYLKYLVGRGQGWDLQQPRQLFQSVTELSSDNIGQGGGEVVVRAVFFTWFSPLS